MTPASSIDKPRPERWPLSPRALFILGATIWLLLAALFAIGIGGVNLPTYYRLSMRGLPGKATVVEIIPHLHGTVRYEYRVAGQMHRGHDSPQKPNPPLRELTVGQSLVVYYDPEHPYESVLGDPTPMLKDEASLVIIAAVLFPTLLIWGGRRRAARSMWGRLVKS